MRLWTLHPQYLDTKGLVACWREALLAQKVLRGETKGYRNHPQLIRFKAQADPAGAVAAYLSAVCDEGERRGYQFDRSKIGPGWRGKIEATDAQLRYEWTHLCEKLRVRDPKRLEACAQVTEPIPHPLFIIVSGEVESWEK